MDLVNVNVNVKGYSCTVPTCLFSPKIQLYWCSPVKKANFPEQADECIQDQLQPSQQQHQQGGNPEQAEGRTN